MSEETAATVYLGLVLGMTVLMLLALLYMAWKWRR